MPQLIDYIDAIARKKKRDVLYIIFHPEDWGVVLFEYDHNKDKRRKKLLAWFDKNGIPWEKCGPFASENGFSSYVGDIYIDVTYDDNNPQYQLVRDYLENPDGTMRDENVRFFYLPLENAMKNAHHDEPDFWDKWAETF